MAWVPYKNKEKDYNDLGFHREENDYMAPLKLQNKTSVKSKSKKLYLARRYSSKNKAVKKITETEEITEVEMDSGRKRPAGKNKKVKDIAEMEIVEETDMDVGREKQKNDG